VKPERGWATLAAVLVLTLALPVAAQEDTTTSTTTPDELTMSTPFPGVAVEPGDQVSFALVISAPDVVAVQLSSNGVPQGWTGAFRGGGFEIDTVTAGPGLNPEASFDLNVPADAEDGVHELVVTATAGSTSVELPLTVRVSQQAGGEVTLTPDFPGLRSAAGEEASFQVTLQNDTPSDLQFELDSTGPAGWDVTAEPAGEAQASTLAVTAGSSETINLTATSPVQVESGQYPISVQATAGDTQVSAEVIVEIVGSFSAVLDTADQRLNAEVSVGSSNDLALVVTNTGTAPLNGITLAATPPSNWEVTFAPATIEQLPPGESTVVTATITPSSEAVAGDYIITFNMDHEEVTDSIEVRTNVNPSPVWGFVGIAVVALTLAALAWVFRRFGRR
jgi:uncharacterized membrane protein